jgi:hypothetical protein
MSKAIKIIDYPCGSGKTTPIAKTPADPKFW